MSGDHMAGMRDRAGRPIVVVSGSGLIPSFGAAKADNWKRLPAGESGIRAITRFGTEGLKTRIAGTIDFVAVEPCTAPDLSERLAEIAIEEAIAEAAIGSRNRFTGPLFLSVGPNEIETPQREALAQGSGAHDAG